MISPSEKALALSYIHAELLIANLDIVVHESRVVQAPDTGRLNDKLVKLRSSAKNAFRILNKNMKHQGTYDELKQKIEELIDLSWQDPET